MRNQYKEMFDGFAPVREDDELLKAVLDGKAENKMAVKFSKKIFIPVLAAAVLGATAVGASAAIRWNQAKAIEQVIQNNGADGVDYPKFDLYKLGGKELNDVLEFDGYDIKTVGVAADQHTAYLFYDVVFDEDFDYSLAENEKWGCALHVRSNLDWVKEYWGVKGDGHTDEPDPTWRSKSGYLGMEGNVAHFYSTFTMSGIALGGKTLDYECYFGLERIDKDDSSKYEVVDDACDGAAVSVDIDFDTTGNSIVKKPESKITLSESQTGTLKYVELTPFSVFARAHWDFEGEKVDREDPVEYNSNGKFVQYAYETDALLTSLRVKFKDGTVKDISGFVLDNSHTSEEADKNGIRNTDIAVCWESPVDVEQIESVTIGDCVVEIG